MFITLCYYVSFLITYSKTPIIYIPFQWSSSQNERAKTICTGLLDPTPGISKAIAEAESASKGIFLSSLHTLFRSSEIAYVKFPVPIYRINVLLLFTDAGDQLVDDMSKVAAINIDQYLSKMSEIN